MGKEKGKEKGRVTPQQQRRMYRQKQRTDAQAQDVLTKPQLQSERSVKGASIDTTERTNKHVQVQMRKNLRPGAKMGKRWGRKDNGLRQEEEHEAEEEEHEAEEMEKEGDEDKKDGEEEEKDGGEKETDGENEV